MIPKYKLKDKVVAWVYPDDRQNPDIDVVTETEIEQIQCIIEKTESIDMDENFNDITTVSEQCKIRYAIRDGIDESWIDEDQICDSYPEAYEEVLKCIDKQIENINKRLQSLKTMKFKYEDRLLNSLKNK